MDPILKYHGRSVGAVRDVALVMVVVLLAVAFAGCADNSSKSDLEVAKHRGSIGTRPQVNETAIEKRIGQRVSPPGDPKLGDWYILNATAGAGGNLSGFRWTIPPSAVIGFQFAGQRGLALEVAPIVTGGADVAQWCLLVFREQKGQAILVGHPNETAGLVNVNLATSVPPLPGFNCFFKEQRILRSPTGGDNSTPLPAPLTPVFLRLQDGNLKDLDNLFFVVAADADRNADFGIAVRVLTQYPPAAVKPSSSLDAFLQEAGSARPKAARTLGHGNGLQVGSLVADYGVTAGGQLLATLEQWAGPITKPVPVADGRPGAAAWNFNVSSAYETPAGWTYTSGSYIGYCATGRWTAAGDVNGHAFMRRSLILQHVLCTYIYPYIVEVLLVGTPAFTFYGGGSGTSKSSFEILVANGILEQLRFKHVALGTPLETLLQLPSGRGDFVASGLAPNLPP
jgi:hypothetical protein